MKRILLVDDDEDIVELLTYNLEKEGYKVVSANNGQEAIEKAEDFSPELILMDIMMPVLDGIEAGRRIKSNDKLKSIHIIYLTARAEEFSEIAAFDAGADDFLTKPIKPRALMSRINAFFRREELKAATDEIMNIGGLTINRENYSVTKPDGSVIVLPKKEFEILFYLALKPNKVQSREKLLRKIWGKDVYVVERTVDVHIRKVREKIGDEYIKTLKGVGYMFPFES
ncbi:two-component system, OmpR family, alkaline phosphatase synthesis response regulator PhoP [Spirosomataceae bacterium TFI 002]|nr:two-component system, OmpR family, alkaline phosphatase synthesis response regulator PhoP [Spirosomataceae bacterium TFI 002]